MFDIRQTDLRKLNTLTKYPSIETYHKLGERGRLTPEVQVDFGLDERVFMTEKVNGANARIILLPGGTYILGSREELLYARGDLIVHGDPTAIAIVETLRPIAERLCDDPLLTPPLDVTTLFGEVYGGNIGAKAARQYTKSLTTYGFRLFDMLLVRGFEDVLAEPVEAIAFWRERGGQPFAQLDALESFAKRYGLETAPLLATDTGVPKTLEAVYELLQESAKATCCLLDSFGLGKAEGLVWRNQDRTKIAKVRFEEYERTLKR